MAAVAQPPRQTRASRSAAATTTNEDASTSASSNGQPPSSSSTLPPLEQLLAKSVLRTRALFSSNDPLFLSERGPNDAVKARIASKLEAEYRDVTTLPSVIAGQQGAQRPGSSSSMVGPAANGAGVKRKLIEGPGAPSSSSDLVDETSRALISRNSSSTASASGAGVHAAHQRPSILSDALIKRKEARSIKPDYHPQWKLSRVISGHLGWVRSVAVEPGNQWFATGAGDRLIKIWDLATGELKLSLTGHISSVRGLAVSQRSPYLFSAGEDKMVKCWDLETNKVIRHYHGHLSAVYTMALHPTLDLLVTGGRDASVRVWDIRTKTQVILLTGHTATVADVKANSTDPQIISGSMDSTVRLWDLVAGKTSVQLTHHHKSVRSLALSQVEHSFASGSAGGSNIKKWKLPEGAFVHNFQGQDTIINSLALNDDGVLFSGGDNGSMTWWDYKTGLPFQTMQDKPQPGSLDAEAGVFASTFDMTGSRLITCNADKTIKVYSELSS